MKAAQKTILSVTFLTLLGTSCTSDRPVNPREIRVLMESSPATLEPRNALDANGQRLNMLLFRAPTQLDENLKIQPDLARKWWTEKSGRRWVFEIAKGDVSAEELATCIRNYLQAEPFSPLRGSFTTVKSVSAQGNRVNVDLEGADPYFPRNASLFRFYRERGVSEPCLPISRTENVVFTGRYEMKPFVKNPEREVILHPREDPGAPLLRFQIVRDETARLQKLLNGEADLAQNSFSASKYAWLKANESHRLQFLSRDGVNVSYLALQTQDPILSKVKVRKAIAAAIDRESITRNKLPGNAVIAGSFLSPRLEGSVQSPSPYDPARAEKLLEEAGYPRKSDGIRFTVRYKTTTQKDGFETAMILQQMLGKVGIRLELEVVESAVFFSSIRKGFFQLYSSRWVGVSDASIFYRTLFSQSADNRLKYRDAEMDAWLLEAKSELDAEKRNRLVERIQKKMAEDAPYLPLWFWTNALVMRKELVGLESEGLSLSGSFVPLTRLRWQL